MNPFDFIDQSDFLELSNETKTNSTDKTNIENTIDTTNTTNTTKINDKNNILLKDTLFLNSVEYLKYSNQCLYDKKIIATTTYKKQNEEKYKLFKNLKLIRSTERYTLEYYIKSNYRLVNKLMEINLNKLKENNIVIDPKKFFIREKLHEPIKLLIDIKDQTIKGTLYDKSLSYVYDENIDLLAIVKSCKSVNEIDEIIVKNRIINSREAMDALFGNQLYEIKNNIDNKFSNMLPCKIIYSHDTRIYGYPDFIADNWIVDVKTSKNHKTGILNVKNYLQVIGYAICTGITNICLYDIENGYIYKGSIKPETICKIKKLIC